MAVLVIRYLISLPTLHDFLPLFSYCDVPFKPTFSNDGLAAHSHQSKTILFETGSERCSRISNAPIGENAGMHIRPTCPDSRPRAHAALPHVTRSHTCSGTDPHHVSHAHSHGHLQSPRDPAGRGRLCCALTGCSSCTFNIPVSI